MRGSQNRNRKTSHDTPACLRPSLLAIEPFLWTCFPAPGADKVAKVLDYFFSYPDRIEGLKTPFAFWRYRSNYLLAEDDIIHDEPAEIALRQKGYQFPHPIAPNKGNSGGSATRQP